MFKQLALLMTIAAVSVTAGVQTTIAQTKPSQPELALTYSYLRSNAPVGKCGCFSPQGGSASFTFPASLSGLGGRFAPMVNVTAAHDNDISKGDYDLTLSVFTAGVRYRPDFAKGVVMPFAVLLAGGAHAGGSLVSGNSSTASGSSTVFASQVGGGLDLKPRAGGRISIRLVEADYLVTLFKNGDNDHQNILRLSTGIVFRFGRS